MSEVSRLEFLMEREEQELETAYRASSIARRQWHLAIAGEYKKRIAEIEQTCNDCADTI